MKAKLIKLSDTHYIVVDDSEIKEGDLYVCWTTINNIPSNHEISNKSLHSFCIGADNYKKITHSTQPLEDYGNPKLNDSTKTWLTINYLDLKKLEEAIYGYSVEKLAEAHFHKAYTNYKVRQHGYITGFNAHKELVKDKLFTIEDMERAIEMAREGIVVRKISEWETEKEFDYTDQQIIQTLLPKTEWDIEIDERGKITLTSC
jgi:hypothetical protein